MTGRGFWQRAKELILPPVCPVCLDRPRERGGLLCRACGSDLIPLPGPRCVRCGGTVDGWLACCSGCLRGGPRPWRRAVTVFSFGGAVRELVHRFKYGGHTYLTPFLADGMYRCWLRYGSGLPDVVAPVPLHRRKASTRGYNQAELLAREVAGRLAIPFADLLVRTRHTGQQAVLGGRQRRENVKDAFRRLPGASVSGRQILLVDDVLTTGATLTAAAEAIRFQTTAVVDVLTVARG